MSKSSYTDAEFQKDLAELTKLINNYDEAPAAKTEDMEGGKKKRRSVKKRKSPKRKSAKRGGEDMLQGGKKKRRSVKKRKSPKRKSAKRGGEDMLQGGKKKRRSIKKRKSPKRKSAKRGGAKRVHKKDVDGHLIRSFRVIEINGKDVSKDGHWAQRFYHGKAKKNTPLQGAKNAFRWMCKHIKQGREKCHAHFKLIETTKGGDDYGKVFGPYAAKTVKLAKPKIFKRKDHRDGKMKEIKSFFTYDVKVAKHSHK